MVLFICSLPYCEHYCLNRFKLWFESYLTWKISETHMLVCMFQHFRKMLTIYATSSQNWAKDRFLYSFLKVILGNIKMGLILFDVAVIGLPNVTTATELSLVSFSYILGCVKVRSRYVLSTLTIPSAVKLYL